MSDFKNLQQHYWNNEVQSKRRNPEHPIVKAYVLPKIKYIEKFVKLDKSSKILDVGAGNGFFSYYFGQKTDITAVDYSQILIDNNPVEKKFVMDARSLRFTNDSFDLVFCHALLHHIEKDDRKKVIEEMKRVSKNCVVAIEPNRDNPLMAIFGLLKKEERGTLDFSLKYLEMLFFSAGLKVIKTTSYGFLTPNRMPIPTRLLTLEKELFEKPLWRGMYNIIIARK